MEPSKTQLSRDPTFERFLWADVGEDQAGVRVSVLSMLARLDVDPWDEASNLAKMQDAPARQRLEALLARFKDVPTLMSDRGRIALGLLAFLPRRATPVRPSLDGTAAQPAKLSFGVSVYWIITAFLLFSWVAMLVHAN
jgi:hypothetical protein